MVAAAAFGRPHGASARLRRCGSCFVSYERFKTGLRFADARTELACEIREGEYRFITARTVLGRLHQRKIEAWVAHVSECGLGCVDASECSWRAARGRWGFQISADDRAHLDVDVGDALAVELDGESHPAVLEADLRVVVLVPWRSLVVPCAVLRATTTKCRSETRNGAETLPAPTRTLSSAAESRSALVNDYEELAIIIWGCRREHTARSAQISVFGIAGSHQVSTLQNAHHRRGIMKRAQRPKRPKAKRFKHGGKRAGAGGSKRARLPTEILDRLGPIPIDAPLAQARWWQNAIGLLTVGVLRGEKWRTILESIRASARAAASVLQSEILFAAAQLVRDREAT